MKKRYEKPEVEQISFFQKEDLMVSGDIGGDVTGSFGGGDVAPFELEDE